MGESIHISNCEVCQLMKADFELVFTIEGLQCPLYRVENSFKLEKVTIIHNFIIFTLRR